MPSDEELDAIDSMCFMAMQTGNKAPLKGNLLDLNNFDDLVDQFLPRGTSPRV